MVGATRTSVSLHQSHIYIYTCIHILTRQQKINIIIVNSSIYKLNALTHRLVKHNVYTVSALELLLILASVWKEIAVQTV